MYQLRVKEGDSIVARLGVQDRTEKGLTAARVHNLGKLTESIMSEVYPAPLLSLGDAQQQLLQSRVLLYSLIFALSAQGMIDKKDPFLKDPENYPYKVVGDGFSTLLNTTIQLYETCDVAGSLDLLPYNCAYDHWVALITEEAVSGFRSASETKGKIAESEAVRTTKELLERVFPDKKRRSRVKRVKENMGKPVENPFDPAKEPIRHQWLELVIHVGTYSPDEAWHLRSPKRELRDEFNKWVLSMGKWQQVLRQPKYGIHFFYSDGLKLVEVKPRPSRRKND